MKTNGKNPYSISAAVKNSRIIIFITASTAITLLAIIFIKTNSEPAGRIFWHLLTTHDFTAAWLMVFTLILSPIVAKFYRFDFYSEHSFLVAVNYQRYWIAALLWITLCYGSFFIYHNHPLSMDEYSHVFQAKIFAAGEMSGRFPVEIIDQLIPKGFQNYFLWVNKETGAVFSAYWPGFSILLAPFVWLGVPWACNPTIVALSLLLIARIAREAIPSSASAGWAILFSLASPAFIASGITYYSMSAHLLLNLCFAWLVISPSAAKLLLAGAIGGFALALHNPFPHLVFAIPWLLWLATCKRERRFNLVWIAIGYCVTAIPLVIGWITWQQEMMIPVATGDITRSITPFASSFLERTLSSILSFLHIFQWPDELITYARIGGLAKLWLWASPLLLVLAWWGGRESKSTQLRLLGASALLTFFAYFLFRYDQGHGWGYRYFHSAWGVLPILGAAGAVKLVNHSSDAVRITKILLTLSLASLVAANGLRLFQIGDFMNKHLEQMPPQPEAGFRILMRNHRGYYGLDLIQNDPWLRGSQVVALAEGEDTQNLVKKYFPGVVAAGSNPYGDTFVSAARNETPQAPPKKTTTSN